MSGQTAERTSAEAEEVTPTRAAADGASAWSPLRHPVFRALWIAALVSNIGTWMQDVGAGWLMTSLDPSPLMVALIQAATTLPIVILALPAGALADIVDRRRYLIGTQVWMLLMATSLGVCTLLGLTTAWLLLVFTFALGCGSALLMPAWAAIAPELVTPKELQAAITLNSLGINVSRAIGPALAGVIIAASGPAFVFLLNAASFLGVLLVLVRWRRIPHETTLPAERLLGAMRAGLRYARHSPVFQAVLVRTAAFFLFASAAWAFLPLIVRQTLGAGPATYGLLLGAIGAGAIAGAFLLPRVRAWLSRDALVAIATLLYALATLALAHLRDVALLTGAMLLMGAAWVMVLSSLQVSVQTALPAWVRARGLSLYLVVFMGGMAGGSLLWGQLATQTGLVIALETAAGGALAGVLMTLPFRIGLHEAVDLAPSAHWPQPHVVDAVEPHRGPVMVTVAYQVQPGLTDSFLSLIHARRRLRQRDGAFCWSVFRDAADPSRYLECFLLGSWIDHLRQHERVTVEDRELQTQIRACLEAGSEPVVGHYLAPEPNAKL